MSLTILVVEDHPAFRTLICTALQRADFQTIEAVDGLEAVQKAEELRPDLILLDINLPKLGGFEVAERIRGRVPGTRLLFMSQESSSDIVRKALSLGADGYIHKVSAATDLLPAIDAVLAGGHFVSRSVALTEPIDAPAPRRHEILFCSDDAAVVDGLTRYVAAALNAADAAIVLATEAHRTQLLQELRTQGVDIDGAIERGTCLSFDADAATDPALFLGAIDSGRAAAVEAGKAIPRVAFFGERAGRLWAAGRTAEAIQLEEFCGELAPDVDVLCAYPVPYTSDDQALTRVCAEHTAVSASQPPQRAARETRNEPGRLAVAADVLDRERAEEIRSQHAAIVEPDITNAQQAEAALRQSEQRLAREVARARTLQSISTRLISESTPESLYAQILGAAIELMGSDAASVQMLTADQTSLSLLAWKNFHAESAAFWQRVAVGAGSTCSKALSDNERVVVADIEACEFMAGTQDQREYRRSGIRAVQSTPLRSRTGRPLGMISTHWGTPHNPTEEDFRFFDVLARQAADLIERTLAEEALRESEERFRLIASTAPVMIWMSGLEGQIVYLNQAWIDYTGRPLDAMVGQQQADVLHPDEAVRCRELFEKAIDQRGPLKMEHRLRRRDGEYGWVVTVGVPRYDVDGSFAGYIGTGVDITERKLAEEALSTVSQKLIEAHEEERTRIARELHDDINQRLAVVGMRLGALKQRASASAADFELEIGDTYRQIADLAAAVQALSQGLHPPKLDLLGLEAAMSGFCEELSNRSGMTIDVHFENVPKALPPEISLCLYRVLQEALHNVIKHGGSPRAHVSLNGQINTINLTVKDSGVGFDPYEAMKGPGLGLTSMKQRLKVVGGQLSVHSELGRGAMIHAVAPIRLPVKSV